MKKVLIITYYWPPSGGGGVQRWLKFSKYLPDFGWHPIIVCPENPSFDLKDKSLMQDIYPEIEELRLPIWEPYKLFKKISGNKSVKQGITEADKGSSISKLSLWIRGNLFIPDPRVFWVNSTVKFLKQFLKDRPIDIMVTTGPPHSMHLIGLKLKKKLGTPWVADFRDPWSRWDMLDNFKLTSFSRSRHRKLERKVLKKADQVLTVSQNWADEFNSIEPGNHKVITNGFDKDDFKKTSDKKDPNSFVISHFGLINNFRSPDSLWEALAELCSENENFSDRLKIELYGSIDNAALSALYNYNSLKDKVSIHEAVPHDQVLEEYGKSNILLLLLNQSKNTAGHLPGKLFEYLNTRVPVLGLGDEEGEAAKILNETGCGKMLSYNDIEGIKNFILRTWQDTASDYNEKAIAKYERSVLTGQLATLLNDLKGEQ